MNSAPPLAGNRPRYNFSLILAYAGTVLLSTLPDIFFRELTGSTPEWLFAAKLTLITILLFMGLVWKPAEEVQNYFLIFLAIFLAEPLWQLVASSSQWQAWFANGNTASLLFAVQIGKLAVTLIIMLSLMLMGFRRKAYFLQVGQLNAPARPMPEVGVSKASNWRSLGLRLCLFAFLALLIIMGISAPPTWAQLQKLLPALPIVFVLAAMNAFNEEFVFRAALMAPIHKLVGPVHAALLTAMFFGLAHFYGVPAGVLGVAATGFFGWLLARSMLETKGIFWPWVVHVCADVVIFSFLLMGSVK